MTPNEFASKWRGSKRSERAAAQEHFIDLCRMLAVPTPNEADPSGDSYAFEKGVEKTSGGDGFADVWRRGFFAWEYKGKRKDLRAAYNQLLMYREALENPPLLVVCDLDRFEVHTNFTGTKKEVHRFDLDDLAEAPSEPLRLLRALMHSPEDLKPDTTPEQLTEEAARHFAAIATSLRDRGNDADQVAHFLTKLLFCLFAEDSRLLPEGLLTRLIHGSEKAPEVFSSGLGELFSKMSERGGLFGAERIQWFNGGLFDGTEVLQLDLGEMAVLGMVAQVDWSQIEPAIFGTLFERGLDPRKRSQLGAHYTDRDSIKILVDSVVIEPLRGQFEQVKVQIQHLLARGRRPSARALPENDPKRVFEGFLTLLRSVRVLDPACGSGNFLYVALQSLKDLEREVILWGSEVIGLTLQLPQVGPEAVKGMEINHYAAELARVTIWIGEIQWMLQNGFAYQRDPILRPLESIETVDALIEQTSEGPAIKPWPDADFIVGNPPFLGSKFLRRELGDEYVDVLFSVYNGDVAKESDFACYWFERARQKISTAQVRRAGLLATQSIRGGKSRATLKRIKESGDIYMAWADRAWILDGASVHVSFIAFDDGTETDRLLNGEAVSWINSDLTSGLDLTDVLSLKSNRAIAFQGATQGGPFDIPAAVARAMLQSPNPDGRPNSDVVRPWANASDLVGRNRDMWIIDFLPGTSEQEAALYEEPFSHVLRKVRPTRQKSRTTTDEWWIHERPRIQMRRALQGLPRYIATPQVAKHRIFAWLPAETLAENTIIVLASDDDYVFGVLQSSIHEVWARRTGTQLRERESGFRYTPTTTFSTFAFPTPTESQRTAIATAARELVQLRDGWLKARENRTLTRLYNEAPTWLRHLEDKLDAAVALAYGWNEVPSEEDLLGRLLRLNLDRQV